MGSENLDKNNLKSIIASNLNLLMQYYSKSRKQVCSDLDLSYTTYCDWINGRTYPRMDALEQLCHYFRISIRDILFNIEEHPSMAENLAGYAAAYGVALSNDNTPVFSSGDESSPQESYPVEMIKGQFLTYEAPITVHQRFVAELCTSINFFIKKNHTGHILFPGPFSVELPTTPETIVVPDITVIHEKSKLDAYGYVGTPDWIIEISSATSRSRDTYLKKAVYEEIGIPEYWIIDPEHFSVTVHTLSSIESKYYWSKTYTFTENIPSGVLLGLMLRMVDLDAMM